MCLKVSKNLKAMLSQLLLQIKKNSKAEKQKERKDVESSDEEEEFKSLDNSIVEEEPEYLTNVTSPLVDSPHKTNLERMKKLDANIEFGDVAIKTSRQNIENVAAESLEHRNNQNSLSVNQQKDCSQSFDSLAAKKSVKPMELTAPDEEFQDFDSPFQTKTRMVNLPVTQRDDIDSMNVSHSDEQRCNPSDSLITTPVSTKAHNVNAELCDEPIPVETEGIIVDSIVEESMQENSTNNEDDASSKDKTQFVKPIDKINTSAPLPNSQELCVDEFDDAMFVDAVEVFGSVDKQDMLERDFSSLSFKNQDLNRGSVLLRFDPLTEQVEPLMMKPAASDTKRQPRLSEIFKGSKPPSEDGVCLFGTPPKRPKRRACVSKPPSAATMCIEEEVPAHQVDIMLAMDDDDRMTQVPTDKTPSSTTPHLVDLGTCYTEADMKKMKSDLMLHYEELMLKSKQEFDKKWQENEEAHAQTVSRLEKTTTELTDENEKLTSKCALLKSKVLQTKCVFDEYEQVISKLTGDHKSFQCQVNNLQQEKKHISEDYATLDKSFDDLFHRYEKMKKIVKDSLESQTILKTSLQEFQDKFKEMEESKRKMKEKAENKITELEEQIESLNSSLKAEAAKFAAVLKRKGMEIDSLKRDLEQKKAANKELEELCDSLISKVR